MKEMKGSENGFDPKELTSTDTEPHDQDTKGTAKSRLRLVQTFSNGSRLARPSPTAKWWHFLSHLFCVLWLVPIIVLLWLNFHEYIIGASIGCLKCNSRVAYIDAVRRAAQLDRADHDALAALQFAIKAIEVWFVCIVMALVYDLMFLISYTDDGLPLGLTLTHIEFTDIRYLWNWTLWDTGFAKQPRRSSRLILFTLLTASLSVLIVLMGPAAAALILPQVQWVNQPRHPSSIFHNSYVANSPLGATALAGCSAAQLTAGNFSCTEKEYGPGFDQYIAWTLQQATEQRKDSYYPIRGVMQESALLFSPNASQSDALTAVSVPNRLVLRELSRDFLDILIPPPDNLPSAILNNSLGLRLNRDGPSNILWGTCSAGNLSITNISDDKAIHCYTHWNLLGTTTGYYTKCFRMGTGFSVVNQQTNISYGDSENKTALSIFFSDAATYIGNDTDSHTTSLKRCLADPTNGDCNWDTLFSMDNVPPDLRNLSSYIHVDSFALPQNQTNSSTSNARIYCESVASQSIHQYAIEPSTSTNPLNLVQMYNQVYNDPRPLPVHPDWFLAAWSLDRNGTANPQISQALTEHMKAAYDSGMDLVSNRDAFVVTLIWLQTLVQMHSIVGYNSTNLTTSSSSPSSSSALANDNNDPSTLKNPNGYVLYRWTTRRVWTYSRDSRSFRFGAAVALLGCCCVVARLALGLWFRVPPTYTATEMLVGAMQHDVTEGGPDVHKDGWNGPGEGGRRGVGGRVGEGAWSSDQAMMQDRHTATDELAKLRYHIENGWNDRPRYIPREVSGVEGGTGLGVLRSRIAKKRSRSSER